MSLTTQEMREQVRNLINIGKERGYLLSEEVEQVLLPLRITFDGGDRRFALHLSSVWGSAFSKTVAAAKASARTTSWTPSSRIPLTVEWNDAAHAAEESELDLTPGMLDKNNDPVRLYLREMGSVPLAQKRKDEVAIASSAWSAGI